MYVRVQVQGVRGLREGDPEARDAVSFRGSWVEFALPHVPAPATVGMGGQAAGALPAAEGSLNVMKRARSLRVSVPVFLSALHWL